MGNSIKWIALGAALSLGLSGCGFLPSENTSQGRILESYLLSEGDAPFPITEVRGEPIFFGLDHTLFPGGSCDTQFSDLMLEVTDSQSISFGYDQIQYQDFSGYLNQQVFTFESPGLASDFLEKIRSLAVPGMCESERPWGWGRVETSRPFVNLPSDFRGISWVQYWESKAPCSKGLDRYGEQRINVVTDDEIVIVTNTGADLCLDWSAYDELASWLDGTQSTIENSLVAKLE